MHFEEFAEGSSWLHDMDPRVKVVSLFAFALVTATGMNIYASLAALSVSAWLVMTARLEPKKVLIRLFVVNAFAFFMWLMLPFSTPGEPVFALWGIEATREGFRYALLITLKTNAIILMTIALLGTSSIFSLVHSLVHLHVPTKLVYLFFFSYRYISVLHAEYHRLINAMKVRCFRPRTSMHTYRSYAYLVGMLFVRSFDRSERIHNAMLCRGFKGEFRTIHHFHMRPADSLAFAGFVAVSVMLAVWNTGVLG